MVSEEQKLLADMIKEVHETLRDSTKSNGFSIAWNEHLKKTKVLQKYAENMEKLSNFWEMNSENDKNVVSRNNWISQYCLKYFHNNKIYLEQREKEKHLESIFGLSSLKELNYLLETDKINVLDVGSCFNPLQKFDIFNVTAIDICPANISVYKCDFLEVMIDSVLEIDENLKDIVSLKKNSFECIVFSLFLEYLPSSEQRMKCCKKAYDLLKYEGILIIITPDSQHVGKNAKLMKNWRYTLALLGFPRIKFKKLSHITCMVFRKSLSSYITERWAKIHRESYMSFEINTPQDFKVSSDEK